MSYTIEGFYLDVAQELMDKLSPQQLLRRVPTEILLRGLSLEERRRPD